MGVVRGWRGRGVWIEKGLGRCIVMVVYGGYGVRRYVWGCGR